MKVIKSHNKVNLKINSTLNYFLTQAWLSAYHYEL